MTRWRSWNRAADDTGSATVFAAFLVAALVAAALAGLWIGSAVVARHRAQAAADLAALAGAQRLPAGIGQACQQAGALAAAMGARLRDCAVDRLDVSVSVTVRSGGPRGAEARAVARAGPA